MHARTNAHAHSSWLLLCNTTWQSITSHPLTHLWWSVACCAMHTAFVGMALKLCPLQLLLTSLYLQGTVKVWDEHTIATVTVMWAQEDVSALTVAVHQDVLHWSAKRKECTEGHIYLLPQSTHSCYTLACTTAAPIYMTVKLAITYGRKYWRGIKFGKLVV